MPSLNPSREQLAAFAEQMPDDAPILMLNLLRYREAADYPPGSTHSPCSGREAYRRYSRTALAKVQGDVQRVQSHIIDLTTTLSEALAQREAQSTRTARPANTPNTAPATRTWLSTSEMPGQDFSIQARQRQRTGAAPVLFHPDTSQPQPPELLHGPDGFTHQGDKPC